MVSKFVFTVACSLFLLSSLQLAQAAVVCPPDDAYDPCECYEFIGKPGTITLDCVNRNLTDSRMSEILNAFLTNPNISPVAEIELTSNQLTRVPSQIRSFRQLENVFIVDNPIKSIEAGDFNITGNYPSLYIGGQLTTIAPGAFKG